MPPNDPVSGATIQALAKVWYGVDLDPSRAAAIATEVDAATEAVRSFAGGIDYDSEPFGFASVLAALKS